MGIIRRTAALLGFAQRSAPASGSTPPALLPPVRDRRLDADLAMTISTVYRAVEVLAVGVSQLGIDQWRGDRRIPAAPLVQQPDPETERPAWLEYTVVSLALDGNAYWRILRRPDGEPVVLQALNPREVGVSRDPKTGQRRYHWRGRDYAPGDRLTGDIRHLQKLRVPGRDRGLGPVEAARTELEGALDARSYAASWFERGDVPSGILSTAQELDRARAEAYRDIWEGKNDDGTVTPVGHRVRVLGNGLTYSPLQIKPADLQFLETQQFNTTQIARLFGTPASLMLAAVEGNSQTYSNVEQDWIAFTRFTLMAYIREIESALSALIPHGNTVRFNVDALHRSDTKTRYEAHKLGIEAGFLTVPEVRGIEGLDPLADPPAPALLEATA
ncbi:MAG: phage portal protein [Microthrixaceae bacterium]